MGRPINPNATHNVKAAVLARDGFCCTDCGMTNDEHFVRYGSRLHTHRVVPGSVYSLDGCVTLCQQCHGPKPKRPAGTGAGKISRSGKHSLGFRIAQPLADQLMAYITSHRFRPSITKVVELALKDFLEKEGYFPHPPADPTP